MLLVNGSACAVNVWRVRMTGELLASVSSSISPFCVLEYSKVPQRPAGQVMLYLKLKRSESDVELLCLPAAYIRLTDGKLCVGELYYFIQISLGTAFSLEQQ